MFDQATSALEGPIDLLVNNAGVEAPYSLIDMPDTRTVAGRPASAEAP